MILCFSFLYFRWNEGSFRRAPHLTREKCMVAGHDLWTKTTTATRSRSWSYLREETETGARMWAPYLLYCLLYLVFHSASSSTRGSTRFDVVADVTSWNRTSNIEEIFRWNIRVPLTTSSYDRTFSNTVYRQQYCCRSFCTYCCMSNMILKSCRDTKHPKLGHSLLDDEPVNLGSGGAATNSGVS